MSMKIPLTPVDIEPATFRIVAQHLNHRRHWPFLENMTLRQEILLSVAWSRDQWEIYRRVFLPIHFVLINEVQAGLRSK